MTLDPIILFFLFGVIAKLVQSDVRLPPAIYDFLSTMLLLTIGLKGGVELAKQPFLPLLPQLISVLAVGFVIPLVLFPILKGVGKFSRPDAASVAAHYGSVSVGTFAVALGYLESQNVPYEAYVSVFVVMLEIPAIVVGIILAKGIHKDTQWGKISHEMFLGKGVLLLVAGLVIGWVMGEDNLAKITPFFFDLFPGFLALFLLEMGIITAKQLHSLRNYGFFLIAFGILTPIGLSVVGVLMGSLLGLSVGGAAVLGTLLASASYIAVPAAMRISVPEANPTLSLTASLGITFFFNVLVGIPLYLAMAKVIL